MLFPAIWHASKGVATHAIGGVCLCTVCGIVFTKLVWLPGESVGEEMPLLLRYVHRYGTQRCMYSSHSTMHAYCSDLQAN